MPASRVRPGAGVFLAAGLVGLCLLALPDPGQAQTEVGESVATAASADAVGKLRPVIQRRMIPFGAKRQRQMARYSKRHYGKAEWRLLRPRQIVEHVAVAPNVGVIYDTFAHNRPDPELGERPNVCAHFAVSASGQIVQMVSLEKRCRHTVGLNHVAIGIEHVGYRDEDVLGNRRQMRASLRLTRWLRCRYDIPVGDVIGHNENRRSRFHRERVPSLKNQTHGDFRRASMVRYRKQLRSAGRCPRGSSFARWRPDMKAARAFAEGRSGEIAFAVDVGRRKFRAAGGRMAPMASTVKVMLMVAYLRQRQVRGRKLNREEERLLRLMIRRSDDVAATTIRDRIGHGALPRLARRVGMKDFQYAPVWGLSRSNPTSQADFMRRLPDLLPARHRDYALRQLERIVPAQRWGIARVAPKGWRLRFKGGWASGDGTVNHQIALLTRGGDRIGLAIQTTNSPSHAYGKRTLQGIARQLLSSLPGG